MSETFKGAKIVKSQVRGVIRRSEVLADFDDADQILEFAVETLREGIDDLQNAQLNLLRFRLNKERAKDAPA